MKLLAGILLFVGFSILGSSEGLCLFLSIAVVCSEVPSLVKELVVSSLLKCKKDRTPRY